MQQWNHNRTFPFWSFLTVELTLELWQDKGKKMPTTSPPHFFFFFFFVFTRNNPGSHFCPKNLSPLPFCILNGFAAFERFFLITETISRRLWDLCFTPHPQSSHKSICYPPPPLICHPPPRDARWWCDGLFGQISSSLDGKRQEAYHSLWSKKKYLKLS